MQDAQDKDVPVGDLVDGDIRSIRQNKFAGARQTAYAAASRKIHEALDAIFDAPIQALGCTKVARADVIEDRIPV
jgi:D-alanine-D-alanine ligase-like ATP-grasp enzyme